MYKDMNLNMNKHLCENGWCIYKDDVYHIYIYMHKKENVFYRNEYKYQ